MRRRRDRKLPRLTAAEIRWLRDLGLSPDQGAAAKQIVDKALAEIADHRRFRKERSKRR